MWKETRRTWRKPMHAPRTTKLCKAITRWNWYKKNPQTTRNVGPKTIVCYPKLLNLQTQMYAYMYIILLDTTYVRSFKINKSQMKVIQNRIIYFKVFHTNIKTGLNWPTIVSSGSYATLKNTSSLQRQRITLQPVRQNSHNYGTIHTTGFSSYSDIMIYTGPLITHLA